MYHGGVKWNQLPTEIYPAKQGKYETGVGINCTNSYETARRYAKGSRVVHLLSIDKNFKDLKRVRLPLSELVEFVKNVYGLRHKKEIISDMVNYSERVNRSDIPADILNNLIVNYEAGSGKVGVEITKFFVSKGIDAVVEEQHGKEDWMIIFNPKIIKSVKIIDPSKMNLDDYMLPKVEQYK